MAGNRILLRHLPQGVDNCHTYINVGDGLSSSPHCSSGAAVSSGELRTAHSLDSAFGLDSADFGPSHNNVAPMATEDEIERIPLRFEEGTEHLSQAKRLEFKTDFIRELIRLRRWAADLNWSISVIPELEIIVSQKYRISRSLVPAWSGHAGRMEFPARRVIPRQAAIMHELAHVFFPNGNRFLAEGLAVHLQASIGGNPAFPNFARPLDGEVWRNFSQLTPTGIPSTEPYLAQLDTITTPNPLTLRIGNRIYGENHDGQAFIYPIVGSFVRFLIERRGIKNFRALYEKTPLIPLGRNAGTPHRWADIYGAPLVDLENEWKSTIIANVGADTPMPLKAASV